MNPIDIFRRPYKMSRIQLLSRKQTAKRNSRLKKKSEFNLEPLQIFIKDIVERQRVALQQFFSSTGSISDTNTKTTLKRCWNSITKCEFISDKIFNKMKDLVSKEISKKIKDIIQGLSQESRNHYEQVVKFNSQLFRPQSLNNKQPLTIETLVKIQVLSVFFKIDYQAAQESEMPYLFSMIPSTIAKVLSLKISEISFYQKRFEWFREYLLYDYASIFKQIVILVYSIDINQKISKFKNQQLMKSQRKYKTKSNQPQQYTYPPLFQYKLCEICLLIDGYSSKDYTISRKCLILDHIKYMRSLTGQKKQKMELAKLKYCHSLTFEDIQYYNAALMDPNSRASRQLTNLLNLKKNLLKCQWIYMVDDSNIYEKMSRLTGCIFTSQTIKFESYVHEFLFKIAKQRAKLIQFVLRCMKKIFYSSGKRQQLFVCKFQYSLFKIKKIKQKKKDVTCTFIIVTNNTQILFYSIQRPEPDIKVDNLYVRSLVNLFNQFQPQLAKMGPFTLFVHNFWPLRLMQQDAYIQLKRFFDRQYKSLTYLSNIVEDFHLHFLLDFCVKRYLQFNSDRIVRDNFFQYVEKAINHYALKIQRRVSNANKE